MGQQEDKDDKGNVLDLSLMIFNLKLSNFSNAFTSWGISSHILAAMVDADSVPKWALCILVFLRWLPLIDIHYIFFIIMQKIVVLIT